MTQELTPGERIIVDAFDIHHDAKPWFAVVNVSDPERHPVAYTASKDAAEKLAAEMHTIHGWVYEVVEDAE